MNGALFLPGPRGIPRPPAVAEAAKCEHSKWRQIAAFFLGPPVVRSPASSCFWLYCSTPRPRTSVNAELSGLVSDPTGAVIAGAQINAQNTATNVPYVAISNDSGIYVLPELLPGPYMLSASSPGFGDMKTGGLALHTGDHLSQNFILKPGVVESR